MATHDYVIANGTGAAVRSDLNNALAAIVSNNSGSSEPSTTYAYQWWADTNANVLKIRNSANNAWITLRELDGTMLIEDGSASTPGLAFADDTNTGIFSGAADQIGFATGGAERLEIGSSEVVFNDPSNDVDFRVESNGNTHMLFVDAGNDLVGIGTSSPSAKLQISSPSSTAEGFRVIQTTAGRTSGVALAHVYDDQTSTTSPALKVTQNGTGDIFQLFDGGSARLVVKDGGNVGIGTTSPGHPLHVATSATTIPIKCEFTNSADSFIEIRNTSGFAYVGARSNDLTFHPAGSEHARIDSSGRLLVGTSSTSENVSLILEGNTGGASNTDGILRLHRKTTSPADGNGLGNITFGTPGTSAFKGAAWILGQRDGGTWTNGTSHPGRLVFSTTADGASSPTERMRIDSSGQVLVGTTLTSPHNSSGINVSPTNGVLIGVSGTHAIIAARHSTDGECIRLQKGSVDVGSIDVTGSGTTYTTTSDYRLKENVVDLDGAITRVKQLQPKRFNFIIDADTTVDGFLAHEAQTVVPEAVTGTHNEVDDDGNAVMQGIDQSKLVPLLTAALQEAIAKIETLETKVAALEAG